MTGDERERNPLAPELCQQTEYRRFFFLMGHSLANLVKRIPKSAVKSSDFVFDGLIGILKITEFLLRGLKEVFWYVMALLLIQALLAGLILGIVYFYGLIFP